MSDPAPLHSYRHSQLGSFSTWIQRREFEVETVNRVLAGASVDEHLAKAAFAQPQKTAKPRQINQKPRPNKPKLRSLATGNDLKVARRGLRLRRATLGLSIAMIACGALVSVVVRAEIAKMQLKADLLAPQLASLNVSNQRLSVLAQQLSAPARIAALAQTQLHMVFPFGAPGVQARASANSTASAAGQPYSLYYTPSGINPAPAQLPAPTTTVPGASPTTAPSSVKAVSAPSVAMPTQANTLTPVVPISTGSATATTTAATSTTLVSVGSSTSAIAPAGG